MREDAVIDTFWEFYEKTEPQYYGHPSDDNCIQISTCCRCRLHTGEELGGARHGCVRATLAVPQKEKLKWSVQIDLLIWCVLIAGGGGGYSFGDILKTTGRREIWGKVTCVSRTLKIFISECKKVSKVKRIIYIYLQSASTETPHLLFLHPLAIAPKSSQ